ncbi:MAG: hypothetical protein HYU36_03295 [Planctomycetes bacterium]|nr:hypothetical protein [Planctomycetota bacterium]
MKKDHLSTLAFELSLQDLNKLIRLKERGEARVERLVKRKSSLLERVASIDAQIAELTGGTEPVKPRGSRPGKRRRRLNGVRAGGRAPRSRSGETVRELARSYLSSVGGQAKVAEIVDHVARARYGKAASGTQYTSICTAFRTDPAVRKVAHGVYKLAGASGRKGRKPSPKPRGRRPVSRAKGSRVSDLAYAYLQKRGGSATPAEVYKAVVGVEAGREVSGVRLALLNDHRFARAADGTVSIAK